MMMIIERYGRRNVFVPLIRRSGIEFRRACQLTYQDRIFMVWHECMA